MTEVVAATFGLTSQAGSGILSLGVILVWYVPAPVPLLPSTGVTSISFRGTGVGQGDGGFVFSTLFTKAHYILCKMFWYIGSAISGLHHLKESSMWFLNFLRTKNGA